MEKVTVLKNYLFSRTGCSVEVSLKKITGAKKRLFLKRSSSKKVAALKKYLLRKSNFCVEVHSLKKCEEVASPKIKLS